MNRLSIKVNTHNKFTKAIEDSIRELRTNLLSSKKEYSSILFTSTQKGEGKSTISFHLALSLSRCGKKTVWVDCDFRSKNQLFSIHKEEETEGGTKEFFGGVAEYLNGACTSKEIIYPVEGEPLMVIPIGNREEMSCDLLETELFPKLLAELEQEFDYIIMDTSSACEYIDSRVIAEKCDGVIYVIHYNKARRTQIQHTLDEIKKCKGEIIGVVLNQTKPY